MRLSAKQRTRVRQTLLSRRNVPRVDRINFSLRIGTVVPTHVHVVAIPQTLIAIHPAWRGYSYFVVHDDIVIVDRSRNIVTVLDEGPSLATVGGGGALALSLSEDEIREVQLVLIERGFLDGEADGIFGPRTREALITFQRREGIEVTGRIDTRTVSALNLSTKIGRRDGRQRDGRGANDRRRSTVGEGRDGMQQRSRGNQQDMSRGNRKEMQQRPARRRDMNGQRDTNGQRSGQSSRQNRQDRSTTGQGPDRQPRADRNMQPGRDDKSGGSDESAPSTTGQGSDRPSTQMPQRQDSNGSAPSGEQAR